MGKKSNKLSFPHSFPDRFVAAVSVEYKHLNSKSGDEGLKGINQLVPKPLTGGQAVQTARGKLLRDCLLLTGGGVLLAGTKIAGITMPFAACLILGFPFGLRSAAALAGAVVGYYLRCGSVAGIENIALAILLFSASAVFQGTRLPALQWFRPVLAASVCAVLGGVTLLGSRNHFFPWLVRFLVAGAGAWCFRSAMQGSRTAWLFLIGAFISGLKGTAPPLDLGILASAAAGVFLQDMQSSAIIGILMDMSGGTFYCLSAAMLLPSLIFRGRRQQKLMQPIGILITLCTVPLVFDSFSEGVVMSAGLGVAAGILLRHWLPQPRILAEATEEIRAEDRLNEAADILDLLCSRIPEGQGASVCEAESVYNGAAEQVCRCCAGFQRCWHHRAAETLSALNSASKTIIERGVAQSTDFPQDFRENCCHLEGFLTAVNQELEGMLFRRRYQMEVRESRQVLSEEFRCVGSYLRSQGKQRYVGEKQFRPSIGACSVGKNGAGVNGDKGVCFAGKQRDYYVLLCDGMGSGQEASECSMETVHLLERLIRSGVEAESALKIINGLEILCSAERFTTVDLLRIDLQSGEGTLYKWGSAPSFWRRCDSVKKIGTASLPPGVGVGGDYAPEQYRLSLKRGEMLVLASDGAIGADTEATICGYCGSSVHELAALLIADAPTEDDVSAVVVSLKPIAS